MTVLEKDFFYFLLFFKVCKLLQTTNIKFVDSDNKNHPTLLGQGGNKTTI